ncbi:p-aminobenzoyl-glutamate hydrolase subunit B [compost metagenome]
MGIEKQIVELVESKRDLFIEVSDRIWEFAEVRYEEVQSAALYSKVLKQEGFEVTEKAGGLPTAVVGSYGSGGPVIAFLGEFDALSGLSQFAGKTEHNPIVAGTSGHGCGHNLLGAGAFAAAVAYKDYLQANNIPGTVRFYGCPAEESGGGKAFMARAGLFEGVDLAISWHPNTSNGLFQCSSLATNTVIFRFEGKSAHAAAEPHMGRSALDAVELMNIGVNFLREHIIDQARIHYAITNTGGSAPNVVQSEAEVYYSIRSLTSPQVKELFERVKDIARGAALMTGTKMSYAVQGGSSNLVPNTTLEKVMYDKLTAIGVPALDEAEIAYIRSLNAVLPEEDKQAAAAQLSKEEREAIAEVPLATFIDKFKDNTQVMSASTDVGDVSWLVPTVQCLTATWVFGTVGHSWVAVTQGQSSHAHKMMLYAGKTMAATAVEALHNPELIVKAKQEHAERLNGQSYECPIPDDVVPPGYEPERAVQSIG